VGSLVFLDSTIVVCWRVKFDVKPLKSHGPTLKIGRKNGHEREMAVRFGSISVSHIYI
jgi:hypothetical protein